MTDYDFEKLNRIVEGREVPSSTESNGEYFPCPKGNVILAIIGGLVSCVLIASLWALFTYLVQAQWVFMGLLAGFAVGYITHFLSRGSSLLIGLVGGLFAFSSCMLGDFLTNVGFIARQEGLGYFEVLSMIDYSYFFEIAFLNFGIFSFIVYGIAAFIGFAICMNPDK